MDDRHRQRSRRRARVFPPLGGCPSRERPRRLAFAAVDTLTQLRSSLRRSMAISGLGVPHEGQYVPPDGTFSQ